MSYFGNSEHMFSAPTLAILALEKSFIYNNINNNIDS